MRSSRISSRSVRRQIEKNRVAPPSLAISQLSAARLLCGAKDAAALWVVYASDLPAAKRSRRAFPNCCCAIMAEKRLGP
ncbi:hypothetical protein RHECNPAF_3500048 [Rhizobium etli CNPAF512]|nr:hypothetical protein RHECNPAF_3500048 [Rhizobium etli CNPAF512]